VKEYIFLIIVISWILNDAYEISLKLLMVKWFILIGNYTVWELWNFNCGGRLRKKLNILYETFYNTRSN
jgi:hypothetical protein